MIFRVIPAVLASGLLLGLILITDGDIRAQLLDFSPSEQVDLTSEEDSPSPGPESRPKETAEPQPYWITNRLAKTSPGPLEAINQEQPYWQPDNPPVPNSAVSGNEETKTASFFAPPPPPPPKPSAPPKTPKVQEAKVGRSTVPGVMIKEFSFYKFTDEKGVTYMTDAPVDPRYRLFTVQITISRGSAPYRRLNVDKLKPFILKAAKTYKVDPVLITAIIKAESAFDPKAVSWAGARGLMQLMPKTAALVGIKDSFDPEQNIMGGTKYIRMMLDRFKGNLTLAVAAYNSGPERVAKNMAIPNISETRNYVRTVLKNQELFQTIFTAEELLSIQSPAPIKALTPISLTTDGLKK
jgi:soluble lytic murein transglycosylase